MSPLLPKPRPSFFLVERYVASLTEVFQQVVCLVSGGFNFLRFLADVAYCLTQLIEHLFSVDIDVFAHDGDGIAIFFAYNQ